MSKDEKVSLLNDEDFLKIEKKSAADYIAITAKDFNKYEDFVEAKINTLSDTIACVFTHSSVQEDRDILKSMQIKWICDYWGLKREKSLNLEN